MCKQEKWHMPSWMFGVMPHEHMFSDWSGLIDYVHNVNDGDATKHYNRWRFFDFHKVYMQD